MAVKETETETETVVTLEEIETAEFTGEMDGEAAKLKDDFFVDMENPIDFNVLQEENPDIYAWIRIPDTNIDYPIAQREGDDSYYLTHDMYQEVRFAGCIYTEDCNSKDFMDPNTLIYGHNMKNGSMFQNLHLFEDEEFFEEHPDVYIYTPDGVLKYTIFAAYTYDNRHIMNSFDFDDKEVFKEYLEEIFKVRSMDAQIRQNVEVTVEDHIITLATCVGGAPQNRYLVQAVLSKV
jgi:sortase B